MTDLFGVPLNIGDRVVYTTGAQSNTSLEVGIIDSFSSENRWGEAEHVAIIKTASGRKATNGRGEQELISITPIAIQHPELFV